MNRIRRGNDGSPIRDYCAGWVEAWDRFWFTPRRTETLAVLRIGTGLMLLYSHLVLATDLFSFLGTEAWINNDTAAALHDGTFGPPTAATSYLWHIDSPLLLGLHHAVTIVVTLCMTVGFLTRLSVPIAFLLQLMLIHRLMGALFGLDQIVTYCAMYLAVTPCGAVWSVDAWYRKRRWGQNAAIGSRWLNWLLPADRLSVAATVGTRLLQLHLCVIYLFGGLAKARGQLWWDGTALWFAVANLEYQSWDVTFLAAYPKLFTALTHLTLFWEIFYCALVWPHRTRPIVLALAVAVHGGIAVFMGMITFGTMMIIANAVFIPPESIRRCLGWQPLSPVAGNQSRDSIDR